MVYMCSVTSQKWDITVVADQWTCVVLKRGGLEGRVRGICLFSFSRWTRPSSDPKHTEEARNRWEDRDSDGGMRGCGKRDWWEEDMQTSEDHRVCPPCRLPPASACLTPSCFIRISATLTCVFLLSSSAVIPLPPPLCMSSVYLHLCFYSCLFVTVSSRSPGDLSFRSLWSHWQIDVVNDNY